MKLTAGAQLFLIGLLLVPVLLIGLLIVEIPETDCTPVKKAEKQVTFKDLYKHVNNNREWYPFTSGLLDFYVK